MSDITTALLAPRILVIEDEALIAEELQDRLERLGYRVVGRADSGARAIRLAAETRPDLVLMDIRLKGEMDGISAAEQIRATLDVPVVYLTAHSDQATLQRARSSAPFGYVLKPFQERDLLVAIEMGLQRHGVEQRLRESEARYATTLASIDEGVIASDLAGLVTFMNPVAERLTGWSLAEACGRSSEEVLVLLRESDRGCEPNPLTRVLVERVPLRLEQPMLLLSRAGATIPLEDSAAPIVDAKGRVRGAVMSFRDGRPRRDSDENLRQVEDKLRHAQKLEAIGRLASGVAHDFNNLVTAILGNGEFLLQSRMLDASLVERVHEIQRAGERAAGLTKQLMAISRRQVLQPEVVDLNLLVADTEELLRRLIGEDIELRHTLHSEVLPVCVDCGQIEQVLLNLAVNARDAMPDGGRLLLETRRVELAHTTTGEDALAAGTYVQLVVSDTGTGMDEHTRAQLFEPFFTTKAPGRGTGLGLATVYGIVKQSGGQIEVATELGRGTSFTLSLPLASAPLAPRRASNPPSAARGGDETILVVEDEDLVRAISVLTLETAGYTVLAAADGAEAQAVFAQHRDAIRLLVTDVIMPGMNGRELARRLVAEASALRVLYLSGYPGDASLELTPAGAMFLQKPFTPGALTRAVRELLDRAGVVER